jgi:hypothetical protein
MIKLMLRYLSTSFGSRFAVTKDPKMMNRANCPVVCQSIDTNQPLCHETPLQCTRPKMGDHFREGGSVNSYRQIAITIKVGFLPSFDTGGEFLCKST